MNKTNRLSRSADFDRAYRQGKSVAGRYAVLYFFDRSSEDGESAPRLGVSVSRKVGGAVVRNEVKRVLKESFRTLLDRLAPGYDYVIIARPGLADYIDKSQHGEVVEMMADLYRRAELIQEAD